MSRLRQLTANPATLKAEDRLAQARQALATGHKLEARRLAQEALIADPENAKAWLMLATVASPRASVSYVLRALQLRPHNPVALQALAWAEGRVRDSLKAQGASHKTQVTSAAATLFHMPATITPADVPEVAEKPPLSAAALTLLHVPPVEAVQPERLEVHAESEDLAPQEDSEAEPLDPLAATLLHAPLLPATIADAALPLPEFEEPSAPVAPTRLDATVVDVDLPLPEPIAPTRLDATIVDVDLPLEAPPATVVEEDEFPTSPNKAVKPPKPANHVPPLATLALAVVVLAVVGAFLYRGDGTGSPARPAIVAAAPISFVQKSTLEPVATDTPTVTASPTHTATQTPTPSITPTPTASPTPPSYEAWAGGGEQRWIDVNLSQQRLTAMEGDKPVQSFLVSTGLWNTPTVIGDFHVYVKYEAADMSGPGYYLPQVPYVMYFHRDYGIHGTYWHNNFGNPMSHGCVNMLTEQAGWLYNWASVGTLVHVHE